MPYLDTLANLLGVAVAAATLGGFTSQALRRMEKRLSARLDSAVASLDSKLTNENASLDLKLTGQISALDAKVDALGATLSERIDVVSMRLSSTEARLEKLDDRVYLLAARLSPALEEHASAHPPTDQ